MELAEVLQPLIDIVRQDGADLRLVKRTDDRVELQLDIRDATCAECVMPKQFLEGVVLTALQDCVPRIQAVTIHDPREDDVADGGRLPT